MSQAIKLDGNLTLRRAFRFPLQSPESRREIIIGGFLFTSVWFWQTAAFSFASVFARASAK